MQTIALSPLQHDIGTVSKAGNWDAFFRSGSVPVSTLARRRQLLEYEDKHPTEESKENC